MRSLILFVKPAILAAICLHSFTCSGKSYMCGKNINWQLLPRTYDLLAQFHCTCKSYMCGKKINWQLLPQTYDLHAQFHCTGKSYVCIELTTSGSQVLSLNYWATRAGKRENKSTTNFWLLLLLNDFLLFYFITFIKLFFY